jgi:hypothetical protein
LRYHFHVLLLLQTLHKPFYLAGGIDNPLLTSVERMTFTADVSPDFGLGTASHPGIATGTIYRDAMVVIGMNACSHNWLPSKI